LHAARVPQILERGGGGSFDRLFVNISVAADFKNPASKAFHIRLDVRRQSLYSRIDIKGAAKAAFFESGRDKASVP
jgi:hypothetical protein